MPYQENADLPARVRENLSPPAQDVYRVAYNLAEQTYRSRKAPGQYAAPSLEETAHRLAWLAVQQAYEQDAAISRTASAVSASSAEDVL